MLHRLCFVALCAALPAFGQSAPPALSVELNKFEEAEGGGCRAYFLFRNRTETPMEGFELSLAILDRGGVIDRLLTIDAAPLPEQRTTLKLFEIPEMGCGDISEIIVHDIPVCRSQNDLVAVDCFGLLRLESLAPAPLVN